MSNAKDAIELSKTGYAGVDKQGRIVDRREFPDAVPMPANTMFGVPSPKEISVAEPIEVSVRSSLAIAHADLQAEKRTQKIEREKVIVDDKTPKWIEQPDSEGWYWFNHNNPFGKFSDVISPYYVTSYDGVIRTYVGGNLINCNRMKGRWMKMLHVPEV